MKLVRLLFLCFTLFFAAQAAAQSDFRPGYIIRTVGDTLWGQIDYRGDVLMSTRCRFIAQGSETKVDYTPNEIFGYRFIDGKFFISKKVEDSSYFLECLVQGRVSFYYLRTSSGNCYYIENDSIGITHLPYREEIRADEGTSYLYKSTTHIGLLKYYMQNAPELSARIGELRSFDGSDLIALDKAYHKAICEGDRCIVYQKSKPKLRVIIEPMAGYTKFNLGENPITKYLSSCSGGVLVNIWAPQINEKIYFRSGFRYIPLTVSKEQQVIRDEFNDLIENQLIVPIQLEYIRSKGVVRPKVAYGLNVYMKMNYIAPSIMGGFNVILSKNIGLSLSCDMDFTSSVLVFWPGKWLSHTVSGAISITL